jgi:fucose 4-O-acetylase-like acetyltransferase
MQVHARPWARRVWEQAGRLQRLLLVPYTLLAISLATPWVRGRPFFDGFWGSSKRPLVVQRGYEAATTLLLLALLGLLVFAILRTSRTRRWAQLGVWTLVAIPALAWNDWAWLLCFMCEDRELLWGVGLYKVAALAGLAVALADVLRAEIGLGSDPSP